MNDEEWLDDVEAQYQTYGLSSLVPHVDDLIRLARKGLAADTLALCLENQLDDGTGRCLDCGVKLSRLMQGRIDPVDENCDCSTLTTFEAATKETP